MSLDTTISGASANSYVTVDEFQSYWVTRLVPSDQASPDSFGPDDVELALLAAALDIDDQQYLGRKTVVTQSMRFPRSTSLNTFSFGTNALYDDEGQPVATDTIPQKVKDAQCEQAYFRLLNPDSGADDDLSEFEQVGLGNGEIQVTLRGGSQSEVLCKSAIRLLREYRTSRQPRVLRA
jgi:hypothetical protein